MEGGRACSVASSSDLPVHIHEKLAVYLFDILVGGLEMKNGRLAKKRIEVSVGESVRILRKLQELNQTQLSELTCIPRATISAIENGRVQHWC